MKKRKITIAEIKISSLAKKYINQVLDRNRLTYGDFSRLFEKNVAKKINRRYVLFVNSGTSALLTAVSAMKQLYFWKDDDEVIVPAITFIASVNVLLHQRLKPVFVDVEPDYYCIDPAKIEEKITKKTRAIMAVNLYGQSAAMDKIIAIAKKYRLKTLEDSAEAMFVQYKNQPVGSLSDVSIFSTYATHILTTGVGGLITTNDKQLFSIMESLIFHGRDNIYLNIDDDDQLDSENKLKKIIEKRFFYPYLGYNFRLTEMEAALGCAQLKIVDQLLKKRQQVAGKITKALSVFPQLKLPQIRPEAEHGFMLYPIVITDRQIDKLSFLMFLEKHGIETRDFMPLLSQPLYKKLFGNIEDQYPIAKSLVKNGFIIGCHPYLTTKDINYLKSVFQKFFQHYG